VLQSRTNVMCHFKTNLQNLPHTRDTVDRVLSFLAHTRQLLRSIVT